MRARHLLVIGTFLVALLLYIDRACISVAKGPIVDAFFPDLPEDKQNKLFGWVLSIFTLGYAIAQTPSGILADRFGPRGVLAGVIGAWSVLTALTGAAWGYVSLLVTRFLFGMGEAGAFPGLARAILSWFPVKERGLVTGINFSASRLGGALALPLMVWLIEALGWRGAFFVLGGFGVAFALLWYLLFRDDPVDHPRVSREEKEYIAAHRQKISTDKEAKLPFLELIGSGRMWPTMLQYFCSNFTFFFCLGWLYPHIKETYNLSAGQAGFLAALPLLGGAVGNWFSGWLVDRIYSNGNHTASRRIPAVIGFALAAIGLLISVQMDSAIPAVLFLTLAIFGADMTLSPSWSFCVDIGGRHSGTVSGTMNMAGNVGAFCTALAFPYLKAWFDSTTPFFYIGAALNIIAILLWFTMRPDKPLLDSLKKTSPVPDIPSPPIKSPSPTKTTKLHHENKR